MPKNIEQEIIQEYSIKAMGKARPLEKILNKAGQQMIDTTLYNTGRGGEDPNFYRYFRQPVPQSSEDGKTYQIGKASSSEGIQAKTDGKMAISEAGTTRTVGKINVTDGNAAILKTGISVQDQPGRTGTPISSATAGTSTSAASERPLVQKNENTSYLQNQPGRLSMPISSGAANTSTQTAAGRPLAQKGEKVSLYEGVSQGLSEKVSSVDKSQLRTNGKAKIQEIGINIEGSKANAIDSLATMTNKVEVRPSDGTEILNGGHVKVSEGITDSFTFAMPTQNGLSDGTGIPNSGRIKVSEGIVMPGQSGTADGTEIINGGHVNVSGDNTDSFTFAMSGRSGILDPTALTDSIVESLDEKYQYTDPASEAARGTDAGRGMSQAYRMGKLVGIGTTGTATAAAMRNSVARRYYREAAETREIRAIIEDQSDWRGNNRHFDTALDNSHSDLMKDFRANDAAVNAYLESKGINSSTLTTHSITQALKKGMITGNGGMTLTIDEDLKKVLIEKRRQLTFGSEIHTASRIKGGLKKQVTAWARESAKGTDANDGMLYEKGMLEGGKVIAAGYRAMAGAGVAVNTKAAEYLAKGGAKAVTAVDTIRFQHALKTGDSELIEIAADRHVKISNKAQAVTETVEKLSDRVMVANGQFIKSPRAFVSGMAKKGLKRTHAFKAVDRVWKASPIKVKKDLLMARITGIKERISLLKNSKIGKVIGKLFSPISFMLKAKEAITAFLIKTALISFGGVLGGLILTMVLIPAIGGIAATTFSFGGNNDIRAEGGNTEYYNTDNITGEYALHEMKLEMVKYVSRLSTSLSEKQLADWNKQVEDWEKERDDKNAEVLALEDRLVTLDNMKSSIGSLATGGDLASGTINTIQGRVNTYNSTLPEEEQIGKSMDWSHPGHVTDKSTGSGLGADEVKSRILNDIETAKTNTQTKIDEDKALIDELTTEIDGTKQKIDNYEYEVQVEVTDYIGDGVNKFDFVASAPTDADIAEYDVPNPTDPADKKHFYKLENDWNLMSMGQHDKTVWAAIKYTPNAFYKSVLAIASASYQSGNNAYDDSPQDGVAEANLTYIDYCRKILKEALASSEHKEIEVIGSDGSTYMGRVEINVEAGLSNICRNFKNKKWESNPYLEDYLQDWKDSESWGVEYAVDPATGTVTSIPANEYWGNTDPDDRNFLMFQAAQTSFDFSFDTCRKYGVDFEKDDFEYEIDFPGASTGSGDVGGSKLGNGSGETSTPFAALPESKMLEIIRNAGLAPGSTLYKALAAQSTGSFLDADGNSYTWSWDNIFSVFSSTQEKKYAMIYWGLTKVGSAYSQGNRFGENSFDCSSYCYRMYKKMGIDISYGGSTTAAAECEGLAAAGKTVNTSDLSTLKPGDLIFTADSTKANGRYLGIKHVAMYVGNGMIIQATGKNYGVQYKPFKSDARSNIYYVVGRPA